MLGAGNEAIPLALNFNAQTAQLKAGGCEGAGLDLPAYPEFDQVRHESTTTGVNCGTVL